MSESLSHNPRRGRDADLLLSQTPRALASAVDDFLDSMMDNAAKAGILVASKGSFETAIRFTHQGEPP
jgi:hypothetical protein